MNILKPTASPVYTVLGGFHLLDAEANEDFEDEMRFTLSHQNFITDILILFPTPVTALATRYSCH